MNDIIPSYWSTALSKIESFVGHMTFRINMGQQENT